MSMHTTIASFDPPRDASQAARGVASDSDEALALRAQHGSRGAFGDLVERYETRLIAFLRTRVGPEGDAEDIAQEAFVRAWQRLETFETSRRFSAWLFTIAARLAADAHRKRTRDAALRRTLDAREKPNGSDASRTHDHDPGSRVWHVAEQILDAEEYSALWLRYVLDLSPGETSAVLGRTGVGVRVMLHRARAKISRAMKEPRVDTPGPSAKNPRMSKSRSATP